MGRSRMHIGEKDFLLANRRAARDEEIEAHGHPVTFRTRTHRSAATYTRKTKHKGRDPWR